MRLALGVRVLVSADVGLGLPPDAALPARILRLLALHDELDLRPPRGERELGAQRLLPVVNQAKAAPRDARRL